jgi:hypothetical protein
VEFLARASLVLFGLGWTTAALLVAAGLLAERTWIPNRKLGGAGDLRRHRSLRHRRGPRLRRSEALVASHAMRSEQRIIGVVTGVLFAGLAGAVAGAASDADALIIAVAATLA